MFKTVFYNLAKKKWVGLLLLLMLCFSFQTLALDTYPSLNNGKKWRIAYYEGGPFIDYNKILYATIKGLMDLKWIEKADIPYPENIDGSNLWHVLSEHIKSDYLEFPEDAFYSSNWNQETRKKNVASLLYRLNNKKDIDILLAVGTQAGQDFVTDKNPVPTFVLTTSNPIAAGIIKNENHHHKNARVTIDPTRYYRQINIFYELVNFKKLGIIYSNDINGISFSGIEQIRKSAIENEFTIVECYSLDETIDDQKQREKSVLNCLDELYDKIDALYITQQSGINEKIIDIIVKWAIKHKIKTFSQSGVDEVKQGILMGTAPNKYILIGKFEAEGIAKVLNGYPIDHLDQVLIDPIFISLNLSTAKAINFIPSTKLKSVIEVIVQ